MNALSPNFNRDLSIFILLFMIKSLFTHNHRQSTTLYILKNKKYGLHMIPLSRNLGWGCQFKIANPILIFPKEDLELTFSHRHAEPTATYEKFPLKTLKAD